MTGTEVLLAYGIKILAGCLYGYIFLHYYEGDDTWMLHSHSLKEKQMLLNDTYRFFWEFTAGTAIRNGHGLIDIVGLYLVDLEYGLQAKSLGIINVLTNGNYYINTVFWNFFIFWGHYWLFKLLASEFPAKRTFYFILIFFFPPVIFWLSGIRSDGLLFVSIALLLFYFYHWLSTYRLPSLIICLIGFTGVLIFRPPVAALLIPGLISWWLARRIPRKQILTFVSVYFVAAIIFFLSTILSSYNIPALVVQRQHAFLRLKGSALPLDTLQPTLKSFMAILPQSIINTFVRPFLWEAKGLLQVMASLELSFFLGMAIFISLNRAPQWKRIISNPVILFLFFFGLSLYVFIGYTIPFPGAIVRYKIVGELFLMAALITLSKRDWFEKKLN